MGVAVSVMAGGLVDDEDEAEEKQEATMLVGKWVETRKWAVVVGVVVMLAEGAMVALECWWGCVEGRMPAGLCVCVLGWQCVSVSSKRQS